MNREPLNYTIAAAKRQIPLVIGPPTNTATRIDHNGESAWFHYDCNRRRLADLLKRQRQISGRWPETVFCCYGDRRIGYTFRDPFGNTVSLWNVEDYPGVE